MLTHKASPLNALPPRPPETDEQRTARHVRMLADLADLGMQLAHAAAARALSAQGEPGREPGREPGPGPEPEPQTRTAEPPATGPAAPATQGHSARIYLRTPSCKPIDPALLFTRLAAAVCGCIALEHRLTAATPGAPKTRPPADPRRAALADAFQLVTKHHPARTELRREAAARTEERLAADPGQETKLHELLFSIADELGIEIDLAILPDEYIGFDPEANYLDEPDPRATSPP